MEGAQGNPPPPAAGAWHFGDDWVLFGVQRVPSLGPLCNGCPLGDARGGGTLELPPLHAQEQTQPNAPSCLQKQGKQDAPLASALLPAPPPTTVSVPTSAVVTGPAKGKGRPHSLPAPLAARLERSSARPGGAGAGGRGAPLWGTRSRRCWGPHPERSWWPWGQRGCERRSMGGADRRREGWGDKERVCREGCMDGWVGKWRDGGCAGKDGYWLNR